MDTGFKFLFDAFLPRYLTEIQHVLGNLALDNSSLWFSLPLVFRVAYLDLMRVSSGIHTWMMKQ